MDVEGLLGQEHVALPGHLHQRQTLAGQRLLEELARAAAFVVEVDVALVGHHGTLPGQERFTDANAEQLLVLIGDGSRFLLAEPSVDEVAGDPGETVTGGLAGLDGLLHLLSNRCGLRLRLRSLRLRHEVLWVDVADLERRCAEAARSWRDDFVTAVVAEYGEEAGSRLARHYADSFPEAYKEDFDPRTAASDVERMVDRMLAAGEFVLQDGTPITAARLTSSWVSRTWAVRMFTPK